MSSGYATPQEITRGKEIQAEWARERLLKSALQTMDAAVWAKAFVAHVEHNPGIATDEATMLGWFANAIMCGYDRKRKAA